MTTAKQARSTVADAQQLASTDDTVHRTQLLERLSAQLHKKLILFRAAAGFGKTTLLQQFWDRLSENAAGPENQIECVWVSLAAGDSETVRFVGALIKAYADAAGDADCSSLTLPDNVTRLPEAALSELTRLIERQKRRTVIILDEYQNAQSQATDRLLQIFIQQMPQSTTVIVAARSEPACGAAKMRLDGDLAEFTHRDLAFTAEETGKMFHAEDLGASDVELLVEKTMGWPAGLRFAKSWHRSNKGAADCFVRFTGDLSELSSYFLQEVFSPLSADVQQFLRATSILPYIDEDLADTVLARNDSGQMLRRLDDIDAFISPTDMSRKRYRHHPLFADFLRRRLHETETFASIVALHESAAIYFDEAKDYLHALAHAVEAGDEKRINEIPNKAEFALLWLTVDYKAFVRVMRRIAQINPAISTRLWPSYAFFLIMAGKLGEAGEFLNKTNQLLENPDTNGLDADARRYVKSDYLLIKAIHYIYTDNEKGILKFIEKLETHVLENKIAHPMYLGVLNNAIGMLRIRVGREHDAVNSFERAIEKFQEAGSEFSIVHNKLHLATIALLKADAMEASAIIEDARERCARYVSGDAKLTAIADIAKAEADYEKGMLETASAIFPSARVTIVKSGDNWVELLASAFRVEARLQYFQHGLGAALGLLGQGLDTASSRELKRLTTCLTAHKIHLAAIAGDKMLAKRIADEGGRKLKGLKLDPKVFEWRENATLALALIRLEIERGNTAAALRELDKFDGAYDRSSLIWLQLKSKSLRALALYVEGETPDATLLLRELITEGEERGISSFYLEEGFLAQQLLDETARRFQRSKKADEFNDSLLKWLIASSSYLPLQQRSRRPALSAQQQRILVLLASGLDRQSIAREADTTTHNVQYHLKKMFEMFGVSSSARLVAESVRLELVDNRTAKLSAA